MNHFFIHVGLHKTGTTALQSDIFSKISKVRYIGRNIGSSVYGDELYEQIVRYSFLGNSKKTNQKTIREKIEQSLTETNIFISEEWFTSDYDYYSSGKGIRWQEKIYRLAQIVHGLPVKIIVTTREPIEAMFSMYCELLQAGQAIEYENFFHFATCDNSALAYRQGYLDSLLISLFGITPNYIDITELQDERFHQKLSELFGVTVPRSLAKHNTKTRYENGVEVTKSQGIYKKIRGLWLRLPIWVRRNMPDKTFQSIRGILFNRYSCKSVIPSPSEDELTQVRQLLSSGK